MKIQSEILQCPFETVEYTRSVYLEIERRKD